MTLSVAQPEATDRLTDQDWRPSDTTSTLSAWPPPTEAIAGRHEFMLPFHGGTFVVPIAEHPPAWVEPTVRLLADLLQLEPDWDTYGGSPIDPKCIAAALDLLYDILPDDAPVPCAVPTSRGGLQLEWHTRGVDLEVEFLSATRVCGLFEDPSAGTFWEKDLSSDLSPLVDAISTLSQRD